MNTPMIMPTTAPSPENAACKPFSVILNVTVSEIEKVQTKVRRQV